MAASREAGEVAAAAILDQKEAFVAAVEEQRKEYNATIATLASSLQDLARQIGRLVDQRDLPTDQREPFIDSNEG
jgi:hypothetical protein